MNPRPIRVPAGVIELLRLFVVVFFAGLGYQIAVATDPEQLQLGPLDAVGAGVLLGAAVGYVLGGVIARLTVRSVASAERNLRQRSTEQVLSGMIGAAIGVVLAAAVTWPLLLIGSQVVMLPLFGFIIVTLALLGYRVGVARRHDLLALFGAQAGLSEPAAGRAGERVLDTSVAIDGRIVDVVTAGFLGGSFLVPQPVLDELQGLADAGDDLRRAKGRRGLEALDALRRQRDVDLEVIPDGAREIPQVDAKLVRICLDRRANLVTLDTNLAKAAALAGVSVMNLHALALALRPPVTAGDVVRVSLIKPGKESGQAVGYLDDGTMVVAERSRERIGQDVPVVVTSVLTTANGRMVFGRSQVT
ncbi:PIN/TRAM domain-containing protein [Angustibacter sp. McL0619]|uniref:PIN/TRAM domain-containing protein n=1 Tax=Angustibacter sp. McL0619 TaxID=3415676 RepID=UPI003CEB079B